jgi:hypothetical protein
MSVQDLEAGGGVAGQIPEGLGAKERMAWKLKTKRGRAVYKKRKETVEPVFGVIKSVMGFRQFLLRGLEKAGIEWEAVSIAAASVFCFVLRAGRYSPASFLNRTT